MTFVLDSSVALAWILPGEQNPLADAVASRLENEPALVPVVWPLEVHNALLMAVRRNKLNKKQLDSSLRALEALMIEVDHDVSVANASRSLNIAGELGLTVYDASYLELATRHGVALASLDGRMRQACESKQIRLL